MHRPGADSPADLSRLSTRLAADAAGLRRLIRSHRVALVHSNTTVVLGGAVAAAAAGVPHVWHVREIVSAGARPWAVQHRLLGTAAALPCVSVAASLPFGGAQPVAVIHDGLSVSPTRSQRAVARVKLGLAQDRPVIAVLGRIGEGTGQELLVRALAAPELCQRGALGLLAGDVAPGAEPRREAIQALARELGVEDRLILSGLVEPVRDLYGAADVIAVAPTVADPLPGSAVEAAAAGCAVAAAAHGGAGEVIRDGVSGLLFSPGDSDGLAAACVRLIDGPRLRATLGATASQDVRRRFSRERLLSAIQRLYAHVLSQ